MMLNYYPVIGPGLQDLPDLGEKGDEILYCAGPVKVYNE